MKDTSARQIEDLNRLLASQREKVIYYMIALCVAAIGFSVVRTEGLQMNLIQIPLGLAIISWLSSIYFGFSNIITTLGTLRSNIAYLYIKLGINPIDGKPITKEIDNSTKVIEESMNELSDKTGKYFNWQRWTFYIGITLFIIWHVLEMLDRTLS